MDGPEQAPDLAEVARARVYALIASLLLAPPDEPLLQALRDSRAPGDSVPFDARASPFERAWQHLAEAACAVDAQAVAHEHAQLFIGVGTPQVDPCASLYLAGLRMDAPLAALRAHLRRLGLARTRGVVETEDHLGALCETMRVLVAGADGFAAQPLERQRAFFETWIEPWYRACTSDLRNAPAANFHRCVAGFAEAFFDLESECFGLAGAAPAGDVPAAASSAASTGAAE